MQMEASLKQPRHIYIYYYNYHHYCCYILLFYIISLAKSIGALWNTDHLTSSSTVVEVLKYWQRDLILSIGVVPWAKLSPKCWSTQQIHQETQILKGLWSMALRPPTRPCGILKRDRLDGALMGMVWFQIDCWGHLQPHLGVPARPPGIKNQGALWRSSSGSKLEGTSLPAGLEFW